MNILITGGASGLGLAISKKILENKEIDNLFITYNSSLDSATKLASDKRVVLLKCDFRNISEVETICDKIPGFNIDALINNAFSGLNKKHFYRIEPDQFKLGFEHNVLPTVLFTQAAIRFMRKNRSGKIITILSSYLGAKPPIGLSGYVAEKAYLSQISQSVASENASFGIQANTISPSYLETNLNSSEDSRVVDNLRKNMPLNEFVSVEEVSDVVMYLLFCPKSLNGQNIFVNQGV